VCGSRCYLLRLYSLVVPWHRSLLKRRIAVASQKSGNTAADRTRLKCQGFRENACLVRLSGATHTCLFETLSRFSGHGVPCQLNFSTEEQIATFQIISVKMPRTVKADSKQADSSSCSLLLQEHHPPFQKRKCKHTRLAGGEGVNFSPAASSRRRGGRRSPRSPAARTGRRRTR
jgi:hypothetical protein